MESTPTIASTPSKYLTLVGMTGHGKSTTANILVEAPYFQVSAEPTSCTQELSHRVIPGSDRVVVDTPGLDDTTGRAYEIFQAITEHLHKHGGVVALVQCHSKLTEHVKKRFEALARAIGVPFASYCVLITTKPGHDMYRSAAENISELKKYQKELEREVNEHINRGKFARKYVVSTHNEEGCRLFQRSLKHDLTRIPGLPPGVVKTWRTILALTDKSVASAKEKRKALHNEVVRLETVVEALRQSIVWCNTALLASSSMQLASVAVGVEALPFAMCAAAAELWSTSQKTHLNVELGREERNLHCARRNLANQDISTLQAEASRIRALIE